VPNDPDVQAALGWAMWHGGHLSTALTVLDGCLALRGNHIPALRARGEALLDAGDPVAALADLDRVRKGQPPQTQAARALALARVGRGDAAMEELADALANSTEDPRVLVRAAAVSMTLGDASSAVDFAGRALAGDATALPEHLRTWANATVLNGV
jgi:tetratricopeptide (TPR) repeat protein